MTQEPPSDPVIEGAVMDIYQRIKRENAELRAEIERLTAEVNALRLVATAHDTEMLRLEAEVERLRAIEDAAIDAASYFHLGGCGEEDFDPQRMHDLMIKLGRALEPKP